MGDVGSQSTATSRAGGRRGGWRSSVWWIIAALLVAVVLTWATAEWKPPLVEDLRVYRDAAFRVREHLPLYPAGSGYAEGQPLPFTYPPFAGLLFLPLSVLPLGSVVSLWWILSFACLVDMVRQSFAPLVSSLGGLGRAAAFVLIAVAALWLTPIFQVFTFGQVGLFVAWLCLVDLRRAARGSGGAGVLIGLAAAVKLTPAAFGLTLAAGRRWRALAVASVSLLGLWLTSAVLLPGDFRAWSAVVGDASRVGPVDGAVDVSWHGLWARALGDGPPSTVLWLASATVTLAVAAHRSGVMLRRGDVLTAATVMGLASVLASPVSWPHHIVWVIPLLAIVLDDGRSVRRWALAAAIAAVFSLPGMGWTGYGIADPRLAGPLDWLWVDACVLVMAAAVLLLRARTSETLPTDRGLALAAMEDRTR